MLDGSGATAAGLEGIGRGVTEQDLVGADGI